MSDFILPQDEDEEDYENYEDDGFENNIPSSQPLSNARREEEK